MSKLLLQKEFRHLMYDLAKGNIWAGLYSICAGVMYLCVATIPKDNAWLPWVFRFAALGFILLGVQLVILSIRKMIKYG